LIDRFAIRNGCWGIRQSTSLPTFDWLPLEEAWFFLMTATMCTWGLQLAMNVTTLDCGRDVAYRRVFNWARKYEALESKQARSSPPRDTALLFTVAAGSMYFLRDASLSTQLPLMAIPSLLVGLPVGKIGMTMLRYAQLQQQVPWKSYGICAALVLAGWIFAPTLMLLVAIFFALYQFGVCATHGVDGLPVVDHIARGSWLLMAVRYHREEALLLISSLVPTASAAPCLDVLLSASSIHSFCLPLCILYHFRKCNKAEHLHAAMETAAVALLTAVLPPLLSFAIFFNLVYVPRVLRWASCLAVVRDQVQSICSSRRSVLLLVGLAASLMLGMSSVTQLHAKFGEEVVTTWILRATFMLLSAASLPNMLAMIFLRHRMSGTLDAKDRDLTKLLSFTPP